jgi:PAS domain S-box-containing protein
LRREPARRASRFSNPATNFEAAMVRLVELYDFAPIPYVSFDWVGRVQEINFAAANLLAKPRKSLLNQPFSLRVAEADRNTFLSHLYRCRSQQRQIETDLKLVGKNRELIPVRLSSTPTTSFVSSGAHLYQTVIFDLRERLAAEAALRKSEQRFRRYFDLGLIGMAISTPDRRYSEANDHLCQLLGYSRKELLQKKWSDLTHPEDLDESLNKLKEAIAGKIDGYTVDRRWIRKDGRVIDTIVSVNCVRREDRSPDYFVTLVQDVTERKRAEEELLTTVAALRESEERFRLLVSGARDYAMFVLERDNRISYWSTGAERIFGWSAEEAIGRPLDIIFTEEDRTAEAPKKEFAIARRKGTATNRRWHLRKDGSRIWVDGVMHRLNDANGRLRGYAVIARDATDERNAQEQLQAAHDHLEQRVTQRTEQLLAAYTELRNEMEERRRLEREVLAVTERERARISQDLHDSLCQELAATAFLLKSRAKALAPTEPSAAQSLEEAARTVNANAGLARDLARGLHPFEMESTGLIRALRELAGRIHVKVPCFFESPREIQGLDDGLALNLYRIGQEAVLNALKHAKPSAIEIKLQPQNGEIVLSVKDDGRAMKNIDGKGPGLGIHLMRYRANVSGGTLEIDSRGGCGTTVTCRIPLNNT